jgi:membrane protease YdiL (CAAX protease family)
MNASATVPVLVSDSKARPRLIAPLWHTALYVAVFVLLVLLGTWVKPPAVAGSLRLGRYAIILATEWALLAFVWWGLRLGGTNMRDLIGQRWHSARDFFRDLAIAVAFFILSAGLLAFVGHLIHAAPNANVFALLPHDGRERFVWIFIAISAGICEEVTNRGYLQRQFGVLFGGSVFGIAAQAVVFGLAHLYQGWRMVIVITLLGAMLGALAQWRRSLLPGVLEHSLQDLIGGFSRRV